MFTRTRYIASLVILGLLVDPATAAGLAVSRGYLSTSSIVSAAPFLEQALADQALEHLTPLLAPGRRAKVLRDSAQLAEPVALSVPAFFALKGADPSLLLAQQFGPVVSSWVAALIVGFAGFWGIYRRFLRYPSFRHKYGLVLRGYFVWTATPLFVFQSVASGRWLWDRTLWYEFAIAEPFVLGATLIATLAEALVLIMIGAMPNYTPETLPRRSPAEWKALTDDQLTALLPGFDQFERGRAEAKGALGELSRRRAIIPMLRALRTVREPGERWRTAVLNALRRFGIQADRYIFNQLGSLHVIQGEETLFDFLNANSSLVIPSFINDVVLREFSNNRGSVAPFVLALKELQTLGIPLTPVAHLLTQNAGDLISPLKFLIFLAKAGLCPAEQLSERLRQIHAMLHKISHDQCAPMFSHLETLLRAGRIEIEDIVATAEVISPLGGARVDRAQRDTLLEWVDEAARPQGAQRFSAARLPLLAGLTRKAIVPLSPHPQDLAPWTRFVRTTDQRGVLEEMGALIQANYGEAQLLALLGGLKRRRLEARHLSWLLREFPYLKYGTQSNAVTVFGSLGGAPWSDEMLKTEYSVIEQALRQLESETESQADWAATHLTHWAVRANPTLAEFKTVAEGFITFFNGLARLHPPAHQEQTVDYDGRTDIYDQPNRSFQEFAAAIWSYAETESTVEWMGESAEALTLASKSLSGGLSAFRARRRWRHHPHRARYAQLLAWMIDHAPDAETQASIRNALNGLGEQTAPHGGQHDTVVSLFNPEIWGLLSAPWQTLTLGTSLALPIAADLGLDVPYIWGLAAAVILAVSWPSTRRPTSYNLRLASPLSAAA